MQIKCESSPYITPNTQTWKWKGGLNWTVARTHRSDLFVLKVMPTRTWLLLIKRTVKSDGWGGASITNKTKRPVSRCREDLDIKKEEHCKTTAATGEDELEQRLWLALLAGKLEALGQSSQSKCESRRLKGQFPSSSTVWRGAIQKVSESLQQWTWVLRQKPQHDYTSPIKATQT